MDTVSKILAAVAVIAVLGLVAAAVRGGHERGYYPGEQRSLTVSGAHQLQVAPEEAKLTLQVMTRAPKAAAASAQNRQLLATVLDALHAQGIADKDIETTGVVLQRWQEWDKAVDPTRPTELVDKGFEQVTTLMVTVKDLAKAGPALDAAIAAGANSVQDISFTLTPESEARYKRQALANATQAARAKAQILADAAGARLGKVSSISENSYVMPYAANTRAVMGVADNAQPTPINPQMVTISVSVNMAYELR